MGRSIANDPVDRIIEVTEDTVKARLALFDASLLDYRTDEAVLQRIRNHVENWPISTGRMLARRARFYPIFEAEIRKRGLPLELRHLSLPESMLRPWAISHAGAAGLWQLMPGTAREHGLIVNETIDERLDPTLVCAAGLDYLMIQYRRYGDWALALAAYNCGPGNVNRAIRRSGRRDYWKIRRYLPRETRNYVANFIASVYVANFHYAHGLPTSPMDLDFQLTEIVKVKRRISLYEVARITALRPEVVLELNPQYLKGFLPAVRPEGHDIMLPARVAPAFRDYLAAVPADREEAFVEMPWTDPLLRRGETSSERHYTLYRVSAGVVDSTAAQMAHSVGIHLDRLLTWSNRGRVEKIEAYDEFFFYGITAYLPFDRTPREVPPPSPLLTALPFPERVSSQNAPEGGFSRLLR